MGPLDNLFDESQKAEELDSWIEGKESVYEDRMVRMVMTKLGLARYLSELQQSERELTADNNAPLTFQAFHNAFSTFPTRLCTRSGIPAWKITVPDLFKKFTNTLPYKVFMEMKETFPDGEQYGSWGLIFRWNGLGAAILHNNPHLEIGGTRVIKSIGNRQTVYLDILSEFLDAVLKGWQP
jgi:hypothetical protein